jgi:hypothetical protein
MKIDPLFQVSLGGAQILLLWIKAGVSESWFAQGQICG